jgi:hypothetical protein
MSTISMLPPLALAIHEAAVRQVATHAAWPR